MSKKLPSLTLSPVKRFSGTIYLPGSKSISNRALLLSTFAKGKTQIANLLRSDDVNCMLSALQALDVRYQLAENKTMCSITGDYKLTHCGGKTIYLGNAGTAMRFLTAALCLHNNNIILTGDKRMQERPIGHLVDALRQGGATIDYLGLPGCPPLRVLGGFKGGNIELDGSISSQFLSALLMISPLAKQDTQIVIKGELVSKPYIEMTLKMMADFGIHVLNLDNKKFLIQGGQHYRSPCYYFIEGDASSASYFLAGAAIKGGPVKVVGVGKTSIQGDIAIGHILGKMGAIITWGDNYIECKRNDLKGINVDLNYMPDAAMTVAMAALFARGASTIRNIANWRVKETDRIHAMATELRKVGAEIHEGEDFISINPPRSLCYAEIETYNDHRIAMCFSLLALSEKTPVTILNPNCTMKTFSDYFCQFAKLAK